jgi:tRNA 2-thiouridine synthesizing protein A
VGAIHAARSAFSQPLARVLVASPRYTPVYVTGPASESPRVVVDARGLRCPVNWARAKVRLEEVARGTLVEVLVDDPRSERDLPAAAEAEGYAVLEVEAVATHLRILIEK